MRTATVGSSCKGAPLKVGKGRRYRGTRGMRGKLRSGEWRGLKRNNGIEMKNATHRGD